MSVVVRAEGAINPAIKKGEQPNLGLIYSTTAACAATSGTFCTPSALAPLFLFPLVSRAIDAEHHRVLLSLYADVEKVVDMLKANELPKKAVFCRCWRSEKVGATAVRMWSSYSSVI
jgi:hypothetical protein